MMNATEKLIEQGARVLLPDTVYIDPEVDFKRIKARGTIIYPGVRILGKRTLIGQGAEIGKEEAVTLNNTCIGEKVKIKGGYLEDAVLLDRSEVGKGTHIRGGTLMEEESNIAHCVGLKQTILFPFVTLGSLINFCDCLMAGGTGRKDHSEVGSSFIHFNFSPYGKAGNKATASLLGEVPQGVMLKSPRIFLGGEAGLVGPVEIGFGSTLAAGTVYRKDHRKNKLVIGERLITAEIDFNPLVYLNITPKRTKNLHYIGNLVALREWYKQIRLLSAGSNDFKKSLYREAMNNISSGIEERIKHLEILALSMPDSVAELKKRKGEKYNRQIEAQNSFFRSWGRIKNILLGYSRITGDEKLRDDFLTGVSGALNNGKDYIAAIQGLPDEISRTGTAWLNSIVKQTMAVDKDR